MGALQQDGRGESVTPGFVASRAELDAFCAAHPDIAFFDVFYTGLSGVPRGKRLRRHELAAVYDYGRMLPGSIAVVDITGRDVEETGLVWEDGDADRRARPVPGGIVAAPWLGADMGQVMLSLHELDGVVSDLDPRAVLARVIERFAADGLTPVVACELEFYLVDQRRGRDGLLRLPRWLSRGTQVYGLPEIEEAAPFLRDLWAACDAQDIPLEGVISECAPGQLELTLRHKADALRAADDAVSYKRAAKGVARAHGMDATFMAKPWTDRAGSGLHLHVSVNDAQGNNAMASDDPAGTPILRHAIGGMTALLAESMAIFAPNMNSFRRFRAPTAMHRPPRTGGSTTAPWRCVCPPVRPRRAISSTASPVPTPTPIWRSRRCWRGVHHGIVNRIDPGPAVTGDGYAQPARPGTELPTDWAAALGRFEQFGAAARLSGRPFRHHVRAGQADRTRPLHGRGHAARP